MPAGEYLPYRIVAEGPLTLVTTIGPELSPITWATDGAAVQRYPEMLPLIVHRPVVALAGLPRDVSMSSGGTVLLGRDGRAVWQHDQADLLWPAAGDPGDLAIVVIPGADPEPLIPYGKSPSIACVRCPEGAELWRSRLPTSELALVIELYAVGAETGVLCIQHGDKDYNLWQLNLRSGALKPFHTWRGVPFRQAVYPGPIVQSSGVERNGSEVSMFAYVEEQGWRRWTFDIEQWKLISDVAAEPGDGMIEENPHPAGGAGAPVRERPVFPQDVLPQQHGESWTIPALLNAQGDVLVITVEGARWVAPE